MSTTVKHIPISILDLCPIVEGSTAQTAYNNSIDLAQHAERWGYKRYWLAEHHSMPGVGSSATSLVMSFILQATTSIRVGSGGIMLPNHAPLVIAEQFGTLESMFPNRIDLGLGRAPGSDQLTSWALRRGHQDGSDFPQLLDELQAYFSGEGRVRAVPGEGLDIPIWLLGSSGFSANLAALRGLPFAFASHFSPDYTIPAIETYRSRFRPSAELSKPHVMVAVNVVAADTTQEAKKLATSLQLQFLQLIRRQNTKLQPPVDNIDDIWTLQEKAAVESQLRTTFIGNPSEIKEQIAAFLDETKADELIINSTIYDHQARLRSYEIVADIMNNK